jgi:hypothetical protein
MDPELKYNALWRCRDAYIYGELKNKASMHVLSSDLPDGSGLAL